ncbi:phenylacetate-CoA oxygenase subunit PaaJ [Jeotgalibacillus sp. S-D1]|uniref:1,2-phenylacetyl-CoA epoxidase subunit PaaD n=1 Tax=Jeotgalibacillus sp. S-D1 TaxID=2552189 RepID=UPI00105A2FA3|nr:1,2-phenylacetyl-CoA epoxidase subunit PaaD [Jeotgalibacillus sp. S-D1]TDL35273.1 phenylacetate-CoA oxygenase subunit PaaJ [Jeotgalibacillus sp. S-D1]
MEWRTEFTRDQENQIEEALMTVKDPEIDSISVIELGMIELIKGCHNQVSIYVLPTFMGCPALDIIKSNILKAVSSLSWLEQAAVFFIYDPPWTSDRVTEEGRERLKEFGIAPPPEKIDETGEWHVACPYCESIYTTMDNLFGPTACRSILYCKACKNPFEAMKPVSTLM